MGSVSVKKIYYENKKITLFFSKLSSKITSWHSEPSSIPVSMLLRGSNVFSIADMTLGACLCLAPGRDTGLCFGETDCSRSEKRGRKLIIIFEHSKFWWGFFID